MSKTAYINPYGLLVARRLADAEGYTLAFLRGRTRNRPVARARAAVIWGLAKETDLSLPEIGAVMDKDHTSVLHAIRVENGRRGEKVRGQTFPEGRRETMRLTARIHYMLSREVAA